MTRKDADGMEGARMDAAEFRDLALGWGPNLASWPASRQAAARARLAADISENETMAGGPSPRAALREAAALDAALAELTWPPAELSAELLARMHADAEAFLPAPAAPAAAPATALSAEADPRRLIGRDRRPGRDAVSGPAGARQADRPRPRLRRMGGAARLGASAAFAASAALGLFLGYSETPPLTDDLAYLTGSAGSSDSYEMVFLQSDLLADEPLPLAEAETER